MTSLIQNLRRGTRAFCFCLAVIWGLFCFASTGFPGQEKSTEKKILIQIHSTAEVNGDRVLLGEIARIEAPAFFREGLSGMEVSRSPKPGRIIHLTGTKITSLIRSRGLENQDMEIQVPKQVFVKRKSQELKETSVLKGLTVFLSQFFTEENFKVKALRIRGLEPYPQGELKLNFDDRYTPGDRGRLSVYADVLVDGVKRDRINIKGRIAVYKSVVCAAKPLKKGDGITPSDVLFRTVNVLELKKGYIETPSDVAGLALTRNFDTDDCLTMGSFKKAPVVKKGDVIKLVAQKKRLSIVTFGVAREDGYAEQTVWVENLKSGKLVRGLVKKNSTVEVLF